MSSSIHYKFRTTNVSKTLAFDGQSIKVPELKKAICAAENIKAELFDLIFFNSFNKQPYSGDDEIPRNSSVTVQRVPIENGAKIPKISNPELSATTKAIPDVPDSAAHIKQEDFSKMTEEERIKHIRVQSTFKYTTNNYNRKPMANNMQQAPPDYLCNRCNQLGHFPKACPLLNIRKTTGIPNEELMETTADDPQAMLHPSGKFMIPIMHYKAREQRKLMEEQKKKGLTSSQEQKNKAVKKELPSELKCPLCNDIFKEALVTGCCGESFCADCIQQTMSDAIAADLNSQCPNCKAPIGASALFPNNSLRESVDKYKKSVAASLAAPEGSESEEDEAVTNAPEPVSSPETSQQQNEKEEKTPERSVEVPSKVTTEVEKPVVLPTVNLSAMLAATQKPKQPSLPPPETVVNFSQPPPTVLSQPPVIQPPVVPIVDFSKPPPNFKLPDLSQPPPFIPSNIPKINKDVILPLPQSFNVPPPKPILSEPKYDEKDEEAINSVWEKLNVGDDNLDLATLFETRTSYVTPKDDESSAKEKDKEKRTKRHRSKSRERYRRENHKSRSQSPYQKHRSRSRSPHKKRKDSREREASSRKRSREPEYRHKSIEKRSSDRKDRERENGNGKEKERKEDKERKEEKRKSDEQKESITPRDRERYRKYESDDDKKMPKPENELKRAVKYEKEIKKEKEREMKSMPKMHSESPKRKEVFNDNDEIKKASSSSQETLSRNEIKEREKEKEKKKDKVVKEKEREKPKDNGKEREKEKKKDKERDYIEKSEKKKSSKKDKTMDTVEREKEKEKKKSSIKEKKKSKSEEKKKKKRRKSSDRSDEDEEKQKKKRHKEKKHKKDRKRQRESIGGSDDDDSEDDRRKRRKF